MLECRSLGIFGLSFHIHHHLLLAHHLFHHHLHHGHVLLHSLHAVLHGATHHVAMLIHHSVHGLHLLMHNFHMFLHKLAAFGCVRGLFRLLHLLLHLLELATLMLVVVLLSHSGWRYGNGQNESEGCLAKGHRSSPFCPVEDIARGFLFARL